MHAVRLEDRIDRHRDALTAFLRRRVGSDAEELSQEVWLRVVRSQARFADEAAFRAFVFTIARRLLIDHYRKHQRKPEMLEEAEGQDLENPENQLVAHQLADRVDAELRKMKPEISQVFRWRASEQVSFQEIADRQGVGLNTALGRMHRAVQKLSEALVDLGVLPPGEDR